jgi:hypothetical protein
MWFSIPPRVADLLLGRVVDRGGDPGRRPGAEFVTGVIAVAFAASGP